MTRREFAAVAWNNGSHHASGAGYGLKISARDPDTHLKREWNSVDLYLPGRSQPTRVGVDSCRELISQEIGAWLISNGMAPWPKGRPPKFKLVARAERAFDVLPERVW